MNQYRQFEINLPIRREKFEKQRIGDITPPPPKKKVSLVGDRLKKIDGVLKKSAYFHTSGG